MFSNLSAQLWRLWRRMQQTVAQHVYAFFVITVVLAGVLVEALRAGPGWGVVTILVVGLASIAMKLLATILPGAPFGGMVDVLNHPHSSYEPPR